MSTARHLVIFVKAPRMGAVKTRLARHVGTVAAWAFYRRCLRDVVRRLGGDRRWRCWLAVTPDRAAAERGLWPGECPRIPQGPGDLGRRMARVMRVLPPGPVVIVGTDVPDIRAAHVAQAFHALGRHDAVFGPAADGGYWLVGLRRRPHRPEIFVNVRWSTEFALADTLVNLGRGRTAALLETLEDVDDAGALERWRARRRRRARRPAYARPVP